MDINRITVEFKENLENGICNLFRILIESQWNLKALQARSYTATPIY